MASLNKSSFLGLSGDRTRSPLHVSFCPPHPLRAAAPKVVPRLSIAANATNSLISTTASASPHRIALLPTLPRKRNRAKGQSRYAVALPRKHRTDGRCVSRFMFRVSRSPSQARFPTRLRLRLIAASDVACRSCSYVVLHVVSLIYQRGEFWGGCLVCIALVRRRGGMGWFVPRKVISTTATAGTTMVMMGWCFLGEHL